MPDFRFLKLDRYPIVELEVDIDADAESRIADTQAEFEVLFRNNIPYSLLLDGQQGTMDGSANRRAWVEWMEAERESLTKLNRGCAMFHPSTVMRGMMTAFTWWLTPPYTLTYHSTRQEAEAWLKERTSDLAGTKPTFG